MKNPFNDRAQKALDEQQKPNVWEEQRRKNQEIEDMYMKEPRKEFLKYIAELPLNVAKNLLKSEGERYSRYPWLVEAFENRIKQREHDQGEREEKVGNS